VSRGIASNSAVRETFRFVSLIVFRGIGLRNALSFPPDRTWAQTSLFNRSLLAPCSRATVAPPRSEVKRPSVVSSTRLMVRC
jgi:hypothetical protein